jgi:hypothetical protein
MEKHYQQFHQKFKAYYWPGFTCDSCHNYQANSLLYSPARTQAQLSQSPHYCGKCANQLPRQSKSPLKPKIMKKKKTLKSKLKPKKSLKRKKFTKKTALTLKSTRSVKNPLDYYECMKNCCLKKQKISQTAHECRTNALTINSQMSVQKKKAVVKIRSAYRQMGMGLAEFIKANK